MDRFTRNHRVRGIVSTTGLIGLFIYSLGNDLSNARGTLVNRSREEIERYNSGGNVSIVPVPAVVYSHSVLPEPFSVVNKVGPVSTTCDPATITPVFTGDLMKALTQDVITRLRFDAASRANFRFTTTETSASPSLDSFTSAVADFDLIQFLLGPLINSQAIGDVPLTIPTWLSFLIHYIYALLNLYLQITLNLFWIVPLLRLLIIPVRLPFPGSTRRFFDAFNKLHEEFNVISAVSLRRLFALVSTAWQWLLGMFPRWLQLRLPRGCEDGQTDNGNGHDDDDDDDDDNENSSHGDERHSLEEWTKRLRVERRTLDSFNERLRSEEAANLRAADERRRQLREYELHGQQLMRDALASQSTVRTLDNVMVNANRDLYVAIEALTAWMRNNVSAFPDTIPELSVLVAKITQAATNCQAAVAAQAELIQHPNPSVPESRPANSDSDIQSLETSKVQVTSQGQDRPSATSTTSGYTALTTQVKVNDDDTDDDLYSVDPKAKTVGVTSKAVMKATNDVGPLWQREPAPPSILNARLAQPAEDPMNPGVSALQTTQAEVKQFSKTTKPSHQNSADSIAAERALQIALLESYANARDDKIRRQREQAIQSARTRQEMSNSLQAAKQPASGDVAIPSSDPTQANQSALATFSSTVEDQAALEQYEDEIAKAGQQEAAPSPPIEQSEKSLAKRQQDTDEKAKGTPVSQVNATQTQQKLGSKVRKSNMRDRLRRAFAHQDPKQKMLEGQEKHEVSAVREAENLLQEAERITHDELNERERLEILRNKELTAIAAAEADEKERIAQEKHAAALKAELAARERAALRQAEAVRKAELLAAEEAQRREIELAIAEAARVHAHQVAEEVTIEIIDLAATAAEQELKEKAEEAKRRADEEMKRAADLARQQVAEEVTMELIDLVVQSAELELQRTTQEERRLEAEHAAAIVQQEASEAAKVRDAEEITLGIIGKTIQRTDEHRQRLVDEARHQLVDTELAPPDDAASVVPADVEDKVRKAAEEMKQILVAAARDVAEARQADLESEAESQRQCESRKRAAEAQKAASVQAGLKQGEQSQTSPQVSPPSPSAESTQPPILLKTEMEVDPFDYLFEEADPMDTDEEELKVDEGEEMDLDDQETDSGKPPVGAGASVQQPAIMIQQPLVTLNHQQIATIQRAVAQIQQQTGTVQEHAASVQQPTPIDWEQFLPADVLEHYRKFQLKAQKVEDERNNRLRQVKQKRTDAEQAKKAERQAYEDDLHARFANAQQQQSAERPTDAEFLEQARSRLPPEVANDDDSARRIARDIRERFERDRRQAGLTLAALESEVKDLQRRKAEEARPNLANRAKEDLGKQRELQNDYQRRVERERQKLGGAYSAWDTVHSQDKQTMRVDEYAMLRGRARQSIWDFGQPRIQQLQDEGQKALESLKKEQQTAYLRAHAEQKREEEMRQFAEQQKKKEEEEEAARRFREAQLQSLKKDEEKARLREQELAKQRAVEEARRQEQEAELAKQKQEEEDKLREVRFKETGCYGCRACLSDPDFHGPHFQRSTAASRAHTKVAQSTPEKEAGLRPPSGASRASDRWATPSPWRALPAETVILTNQTSADMNNPVSGPAGPEVGLSSTSPENTSIDKLRVHSGIAGSSSEEKAVTQSQQASREPSPQAGLQQLSLTQPEQNGAGDHRPSASVLQQEPMNTTNDPTTPVESIFDRAKRQQDAYNQERQAKWDAENAQKARQEQEREEAVRREAEEAKARKAKLSRRRDSEDDESERYQQSQSDQTDLAVRIEKAQHDQQEYNERLQQQQARQAEEEAHRKRIHEAIDLARRLYDQTVTSVRPPELVEDDTDRLRVNYAEWLFASPATRRRINNVRGKNGNRKDRWGHLIKPYKLPSEF